MAGAGFKSFTAGSVLTASDVNTYLIQQSTMVFATTTARDAAITSPSEGMQCYITDSNRAMFYDGTAWRDAASQSRVHGVRATRSSGDLTIATNPATTAIAFTSESEDTDAYHDNATNNTRFTVPTGLGGLYHIRGSCRWGATSITNPIAYLRKNGNVNLGRHLTGTGSYAQNAVSVMVQLVAGDYVEFVVYHESGADRTVSFNSTVSGVDGPSPEFAMYLVGGPNVA
jgi:hypothetical protein